jgi:hypothetical protein
MIPRNGLSVCLVEYFCSPSTSLCFQTWVCHFLWSLGTFKSNFENALLPLKCEFTWSHKTQLLRQLKTIWKFDFLLTNIFYLNSHVSNFSFPQTLIFNSLEHFSLIRFANLVKNKSGEEEWWTPNLHGSFNRNNNENTIEKLEILAT